MGGHAYVDEQTADEMRVNRGTLTEAGKDSPYRNSNSRRKFEAIPRNARWQTG